MKRLFVDANVFMRFFTRDDAGEHKRAVRLFKNAASDKVKLVCGPPVLFEVAWTLRASYNQSREKVLDVLSRILSLPGLEMTDADLVEDAIRRSRSSGVEFADAYIMASAETQGVDAIGTFNKSDFKKLGSTLYPF